MSHSSKINRLKNWIAVIETFMVLFGLWALVGGIVCLLAPVPMRGEPAFTWLFVIPVVCVIVLCVPREMLLKSEANLIAREAENDHAL